MVVRTNVNALRSGRNLNKNNKTNAKSLEKLASGYKINRAGDDASGLAISEKMKAQIKALGTASNNCEDGISLVQTAEGYLAEVHNMLNRMVELSMKSANGILEDSGNTSYKAYGYDTASGEYNAGTDRAALQEEMDHLCAEIDRVAMTANFNGNKLFYPDDQETIDEWDNLTYWNQWKNADGSGVKNPYADFSLQVGETSNKADKLVVSFKYMTTDAMFMRNQLFVQDVWSSDGSTLNVQQNTMVSNQELKGLVELDGTLQPFKGNKSAHTWGCSINISDQAFASKATEVIRTAIDEVSMQRANIGAIQNRLDYTINNLDTAKENMESANSRIRDTDMAKEMMKYTQSNVLTQAAQSMLAQANTQPQNVLSLLQ
ncbi:MAG: flagellin [Oscillospiraceae bacterium]|nr:flagellin [Oscillospiraceae bacterium]